MAQEVRGRRSVQYCQLFVNTQGPVITYIDTPGPYKQTGQSKIVTEQPPTAPPYPAMPRFSIKDLLIATTLISAGMGLLYFAYQHRYAPDDVAWELGATLGGGALMGAGIMTPFKRPVRGAIIALVIMLLAGLVV